MKTLKRTLILILIFIIGMTSYSQNIDEENNLSFHSFSFAPEIFFMDDFYTGGFSLSSELSWNSKKNIFTLSASIGEEFVLWGNADNFQQLNVLYGREFKLNNWFFIDAHTGVGILFYNMVI
ncbi:hypothetical protein [Tamlana flava]|uniref:hypothetical protein n=1 Tax=Tamlana flava TaxID=3158572 RepID=UPI00351BA67C